MKTETAQRTIGGTALLIAQLISVICIAGGFLSMLIVLLTRSKTNFTGAEVFYDKVNLSLFNTIVLNGVIVLIITLFLYNAFTKWQFRNCPFMVIDAGLIFIIFCIGYLRTGFAISGMASISDAGFHTGEMSDAYLKFWNQAEVSLWLNLGLIVLALVIAVYKPFGCKNKAPYRHRKIVLPAVGLVLLLGVGLFIRSEFTLFRTRSLPIQDISAEGIADGSYEGQNTYGGSTVRVIVTVRDQQIVKIEDPMPDDSVFTKYASGVFHKITSEQTANVDAISGATTTSKSYMKAVENALTEAALRSNP